MFTHLSVFKDWIITKTFWKQKNYKYFKLILYRNSTTQWTRLTCNMLAHCTISFISTSALKRLYLLSILSQWRSSFPFWLGAYYRAVQLSLYLCVGLCLNMKTALFLIKLSSITTGTSMGHFTPKNHPAKYLMWPWTNSLEEEKGSSSNSLPSESWP